ncbi:MAG: CDP-diacylglycerol---glycerol-3-phosphate 3-phosphatidyltransferase, partial [Solirubrobacteraceae bacterium]|nr:CDP-diacylglycerol---glycerol-3-phosphate 3-phosphatidyltransferase [Solirubrobacteraceae bacterium]
MGTRISSVPSLRSAWVLNAGTLLRIVLTPVVMALVLLADERALACVLFVVAAATDWFDGYLARRWNVTTTLGSFLDTTADKLLVTGVLIALLGADRVSPWIAGLIIGREIIILGLRGAVAVDGAMIQPSIWGKLKTTVQFVAILLAILRPGEPLGGLHIDEWAMLAAALVTVLSAADYLQRFSSA